MIVHACSPLGSMVDFMRANPYVSKEEYLWQWTLPQANLASMDFTHTVYLSEKQAAKRKDRHFDDPKAFMRDMGLPLF